MNLLKLTPMKTIPLYFFNKKLCILVSVILLIQIILNKYTLTLLLLYFIFYELSLIILPN